jgi:4-amino-4-deoxy-L-arabinose transferase-like glycosyltransferase
MEISEKTTGFWQTPIAIAYALALFKIFLFFVAGGSYGYFRDELYFLACTEHLAFGYPDHAPLSVWIAKFSRAVLGDSLYAIRFLPALAGALKIILTGLLVREFGGKHFATLLACLCVLVAPMYLAMDNLLSMNAYEPLFWTGCALAYVLVIKRENPKYWLLFGSLAGLGLMNKHSLVFFGLAFVVGLIFTVDRRFFADKFFWLAGLIAFLMFLPNLIWQYQNDWATLELLRNVQKTGKNVVLAPHEFFFQQIYILFPSTAPVWLAGLWHLLVDKSGRRFRALGIAYLVTLALMILLKAKNYYLAPIYPMLFAAGSVFLENLTQRFRFGKFFRYAYPALLIIGGLMVLPLAITVLPIERFIAYQNTLGIAPPKTEVGHQGVLPQHFGDMFGWEEMTAKVAEVYHSLPPEEREKAAIFANNYGQAGAIDLFGKKYGLPKAISNHQSYYLWGYGNADGSVVIILGDRKADAEEFFQSVEEKTRVGEPLAMREENFNILVGRGMKQPFSEIWTKIKNWN